MTPTERGRCGIDSCPCSDGDPCNYEDHGDTKAMPHPDRGKSGCPACTESASGLCSWHRDYGSDSVSPSERSSGAGRTASGEPQRWTIYPNVTDRESRVQLAGGPRPTGPIEVVPAIPGLVAGSERIHIEGLEDEIARLRHGLTLIVREADQFPGHDGIGAGIMARNLLGDGNERPS